MQPQFGGCITLDRRRPPKYPVIQERPRNVIFPIVVSRDSDGSRLNRLNRESNVSGACATACCSMEEFFDDGSGESTLAHRMDLLARRRGRHIPYGRCEEGRVTVASIWGHAKDAIFMS